MSQLFVDNIENRSGGAIGAPSGIVVTGVVTATSFVGSAASLTGIDATALKDSGGGVKIQANTSGIVVTGVSTFSGNVSVGGVLTYEDVTNIDSIGIVTARSGVKVPDAQKIFLGTGDDLQIYHSGSHSFIVDSGVGSLYIRTSAGNIQDQGNANQSWLQFNSGAGVEAHFAGNKKFETTTNGVTVTGTASATTFSGSGASLTNLPAGNLTGALPAIDGSALTNISGTHSDIVSVWTLGASGSSHYTFTGPGLTGAENDPTIYLVRGQTYRFTNNSGGSHPFQIRYNSNGTAYSDGVTNNGASSGNIDFNVQYDAPDVLYYQCTNHSGMLGKIIILGDVVNEGSWTASAGAAQTIDTITGVANNAIKTAEYTIHIENGSNMQAQKVLVMQDGTTAFSQEYAIMHKSGLLVSMSATISGGNLLLQATPETGVSGTTTYKVTRQTMR